MTKWIVALDLIGYYQHSDMIGNIVKRNMIGRTVKRNGVPQPASDDFANISKDDIVVYYAIITGLVVGLFRVTSQEMLPLSNDSSWSDSLVHKIEQFRMPPEGMKLDLKKLLRENEQSNPFKKISISKLESYSQKNICERLDEEDYSRIEKALFNCQYLVKLNGPCGWKLDKDLLSGLLDFYNTRTTSFISLFVASIFGIVTLSAIIKSIVAEFAANPNGFNYLPVILTVIPYVIFAFAGYYTLKSYSFYADIAEKIKSCGLEIPYYPDLNKIVVPTKVNGLHRELGLVDSMLKKEGQYSKSALKRFLNRFSFGPLFFVAMASLTIVVYWQGIIMLLQCLEENWLFYRILAAIVTVVVGLVFALKRRKQR